MSGELKQRLAAILAADAAGYSRLMSLDERATVAALDAARLVFHTQTVANQGRIVDTAGDSVLAIFETATGALNAALQIQADLAEVERSVPMDSRMRFRIGIHLGDVMEKADGSVYGDGVNIAARLQALAEPGQITISEAIHGAVRGRVSAAFTDQGEQQVKNIAYPVRAYRIQIGDKAGHLAPEMAKPPVGEIDLSLPDKPSIAVLPFTNMSGDPEQEYFTDGITEDIITELSRFHELFVIARNSSFTYKGKAVDVRTVAKDLGVRYVLEGSIRRAANRIRVTAQLIDAITGNHIWAERYDRVLEDIFAVQEEVTQAIVIAIAPQIEAVEREKARRRPDSLSAYEIAVRASCLGLEGMARSDPALIDQSLRGAREALTIDPRSVLALESVALGQGLLLLLGSAADPSAAWQEGMGAAKRAIEVDRSDSAGYLAKGFLLVFAGRRIGTEEFLTDLRRALELNPNSTMALQALGFGEVIAGISDKAIGHLQQALRTSPRDPQLFNFHHLLAMANLCIGNYLDGVDSAVLSIAHAPGYGANQAYLAANCVGLGDMERARTAMDEARRLAPGFVQRAVEGDLVFRKPEDLHRATTFVRIAAGLEDPSAADALR